MSNFKSDPENYYNMYKPHENAEKANEALQLFFEKVSLARKECKIADIIIVVKDNVLYPDGKIGQFMNCANYGNQLNAVSMAAFAYGQLKAEERERINKILTGDIDFGQ